jgi:peptide chain release factor subunit 1
MAFTKYEIESVLEELEKVKGRHTELISVYIPAEANINVIANQIESEKSTADNIKSKGTRKNVVDALESISRELKFYKKTPENGMAIFCGNIAEKEGQIEMKTWVIEPPKPLKVRLYRCDKEFVLEPLREMTAIDEVYGLVVMDRKEATFGVLEGKNIKVLRTLTSGVPGKVRAGGQSSARFARITEGLAKEFFRRIAENMKELYFDMPKLKGILIGGPIPTKEDFLKEGELVTALKNKVIGVKDIGNTDESGLHDLVEISQDILQQQEIIKEKKLLENFFTLLAKTKKAIYGKDKIEKAIQYAAIETLFLSKDLDKREIREIREKVEQIGSNIEMISTETEEGEQFHNLSGIGAILRFEINS